jgi:hypothetical protein
MDRSDLERLSKEELIERLCRNSFFPIAGYRLRW